MKKPVYYYINRVSCKHKNAKERMMAESFENYRNIIITPEAAELLADRIERCVTEANIRYPRNKEFYSKRYIMNDDKTPSTCQCQTEQITLSCLSVLILSLKLSTRQKICNENICF